MATIFSLSFLFVAPFWGLMIVAPRWQWSRRIIASPWIVAPVSLLYVALLLPMAGDAAALLSPPELATTAAMLGTPDGATVAWAHFLAFDLFTGRWAYLDSQEKGLSPWLTGPILLLILMLGPLGLLLYLLASGRLRRS